MEKFAEAQNPTEYKSRCKILVSFQMIRSIHFSQESFSLECFFLKRFFKKESGKFTVVNRPKKMTQLKI